MVPKGQKVKISQHHHNLSGANAKVAASYLSAQQGDGQGYDYGFQH